MEKMIHPTAIVDPKAKLEAGVVIGPYCTVGPHVELGENVKLYSHVVIDGHTKIGARTQIFPFACIGLPPQNRFYHGEPSTVEIGHDTLIREYVTIHPGTENGAMKTTLGHHCQIMIGAHIAHDCQVGNYVVMANNATIAGHVTIGDYANVGGLAAIHQFVRVGPHAMIAGTAGVNEDVMPFGTVMTIKSKLGGLNIIGMKRRGFTRSDIHELRGAYKLLAKDQEGTLENRLQRIKDTYSQSKTVKELIEFIEQDPQRPLCLPAAAWEFEGAEEDEPKEARA